MNFGGHRQTVAIIGFLATWWTGLIIGVTLGLTALIFNDHKKMSIAIRKSIKLLFVIAISFGVIGFLLGKFYFIKTGVDWWLPNDLVDKNSFITVGSIHNFSYLGGIIGLLAGTLNLIWLKTYKRVAILLV